MIVLLRACACLATLAAVLGLSQRLMAKPPDLPLNDPPTLSPEERSDGKENPAGEITPCPGLPGNGEKADEALVEPCDPALKSAGEESPPKPAGSDGFTCPYLKQQAADRHAAMIADPEVSQDVLSNLKKLEAAQSLIEAADKLQQAGQRAEALRCLSLAQKLCPGSRCAAEAAEKAQRLEAKKRPTVSVIVIQGNKVLSPESISSLLQTRINTEYNPKTIQDDMTHLWLTGKFRSIDTRSAPDGPGKVKVFFIVRDVGSDETVPSFMEAGVEEMVRGLVKACRLAVADNRQEQALSLVQQVLALDPRVVLTDPLISRLARRACRPRKHERVYREQPTCPACPPCSPVQVVTPLVPFWPSVDGGIVQAFEQLMQEAEQGAHSPGAEQAEIPETAQEPASPKTCPAEHPQAGDEAKKEAANDLLGCLEQWLQGQEHGTVMIGVGRNEERCLLKCNLTLGETVYHLVVGCGCPTLWTTPNASAAPENAAR